jgi:putative phosphoribosyl transferase
MESSLEIPLGVRHLRLSADLAVPADASGLVLFAHGSGSSRHSPRNRSVAAVLQGQGFATLLADLLTSEEDLIDERTGQFRFDIKMLADRLVVIIDWLRGRHVTAAMPFGLFGASTGAGAALVAAAARPHDVAAVVSRGGRPDLAGLGVLSQVRAPTLLIVGSLDTPVIAMNRDAMAQMQTDVRLEIVPGATHLFEEPATLAQVAALAADWFAEHLVPAYAQQERTHP